MFRDETLRGKISRCSLGRADCTTVALAHKRWSRGETGKVVLEDTVVTTDPLLTAQSGPADVAFLSGLRLSQ